MELSFTIHGKPMGQQRPKFSTANGIKRAYDPPESRNYKAMVAMLAQQAAKKQGWVYTEEPVIITIVAYMPIAKSKSKKFKQRALEGLELPTGKPDVDNIFKIVADGLTLSGVIWQDDKQVVDGRTAKRFTLEPRVTVQISTFG